MKQCVYFQGLKFPKSSIIWRFSKICYLTPRHIPIKVPPGVHGNLSTVIVFIIFRPMQNQDDLFALLEETTEAEDGTVFDYLVYVAFDVRLFFVQIF